MTREALVLPTDNSSVGAGVYIHWPFCKKKCPYCDFNSHVREKIDQKSWRTALSREIETFAAHFPNIEAKSIFFGGGTPSLMDPDTTAALIETVKKCWKTAHDIEITLEANPSSIEAARFAHYNAAGVNRVSVGIQSLNDQYLKFLGRLHTSREALKALDIARNNFRRVSFDLIYALPQQSLEDWKASLQQALGYSPSHLSLYQLTIEEGTAFYHQYKRGRFTLPDENLAADMFLTTQDMCEAANLPAYETSNHAKTGEESQHNLIYWRGQPYIGIGPGAHGRLSYGSTGAAHAHMQIKRPEDWLKAVEKQGHGLNDIEFVSADERAVEAVMMGLRLKEGINKERFRNLFNREVDDVLNLQAMKGLSSDRYIENSETFLKVTPKGTLLVNHIIEKIIP